MEFSRELLLGSPEKKLCKLVELVNVPVVGDVAWVLKKKNSKYTLYWLVLLGVKNGNASNLITILNPIIHTVQFKTRHTIYT